LPFSGLVDFAPDFKVEIAVVVFNTQALSPVTQFLQLLLMPKQDLNKVHFLP
jgi:hypothetical protein